MAIQDRYHRQRLVEGFGDAGQHALSETTIAIVGLGALGNIRLEPDSVGGDGRFEP